MNTKIETVVLQSLVNNEEYMRKVIPFLKRDYFIDNNEQKIFEHIKKFIDEYNTVPNKDALIVAVQNDKNLNEEQYKEIAEYILALDKTEHNKDWLS